MSHPVELRTDRPVPNCLVLSVMGEIDLVTVSGLEVALAEHVAAAPRLVVDLSGVTFFGSIGLAAIIRAATQAEESGSRLVVVAGERVRRTMELTRTAEFFTVYDSLDDALRDS